MSKHRRTIRIDKPVDAVVKSIVSGVLYQSQSAVVKEELDFNVGTTECHIRMIERYSVMGGNYVAMTIAFLADTTDPGKLEIVAVTGGGASSALVPIGWGERRFQKTLTDMLDVRYPDSAPDGDGDAKCEDAETPKGE